MQLVELGSTGIRASRVGFGAAGIGGYDYGPADDSESLAAIDAALDAGITFFDTADVYGLGRSETLLGKAMQGRRSRFVLATKGGVSWTPSGATNKTLQPAHLAKAIDESLRRLRTDYIDLYQLHWPDPLTPLADALAVVDRARAAGKLRAIGVCNFSRDEVSDAARHASILTLQVPFSLVDRERSQLLDWAQEPMHIAPICYNVLGHGLLTGKIDATRRFVGTDLRLRVDLFRGAALENARRVVERLRVIAAARGATPGQVAIRWVLDRFPQSIALTGIKTPTQASMNANAARVLLTGDDRQELETL